jgi:UDP-glucuronate 4-epimerase
MKILVTGAAGFIGFFVSQGLLARGDEVVGLDNLNDYYDPRLKASRLEILNRHKNFRFVKLDLVDPGGIENLVYPSTISVYGANTHMPFAVDQNVDHPLTLYAAT